MNTVEPDERGLIRACPQCGQRNRLIYERLGSIFRCTKCRTEIPQPTEPVEVRGCIDIRLAHRSVCAARVGRFLGAVVWSL